LPSPASPIVELLAELRQALARLGVRWYLFGAQAAILHGVDRLTADVDVTADPGPHPTARLVAGLGEAGFELRVADVGGPSTRRGSSPWFTGDHPGRRTAPNLPKHP
jgi:hypothetical protein